MTLAMAAFAVNDAMVKIGTLKTNTGQTMRQLA
jgi:hypothetical protein